MLMDIETLPWAVLTLSEPEIPWEQLHVLADAVADSEAARQRLIDEARGHFGRRYAGDESVYPDLTDLSAIAVLALAADRFNAAGRDDAARFLLEVLCRSAAEDDDCLTMVGERAAGRLGAAVVAPALSLLKDKRAYFPGLFHVSALLKLAKDADESTRQAAVEHCREWIRREAEKDEDSTELGYAALMLADLNDKESLPLLESVKDRCFPKDDVLEAIAQLRGEPVGPPLDSILENPWLEPVEQWLPREVKETRDWLARPDSDDPATERELDEDSDAFKRETADDRYADLLREFRDSNTVSALFGIDRDDAEFFARCFLQFSWDNLNVKLDELDRNETRHILLVSFPTNVAVTPNEFGPVPKILTTFLTWLGEKGLLTDADSLCKEVRACSSEMLTRSANPECFSTGKIILLSAMTAGIDPDDREAVDQFARRMVSGRRITDTPPPTTIRFGPDGEVVGLARSSRSKIGRNEPCNCGSGKKYKKCCGK